MPEDESNTISDKKLAANRENARKSHGPATPEGLEKCRTARLRSNVLANSIVLDGLESSPEFRDLLASLESEFEPQTPVEYTLLERLASARWREMRIWSLEKACFTHEIRRHAATPEGASQDGATQAALAFRHLTDNSRFFKTINIFESRFDRQCNRILNRLYRIRAGAKRLRKKNLSIRSH